MEIPEEVAEEAIGIFTSDFKVYKDIQIDTFVIPLMFAGRAGYLVFIPYLDDPKEEEYTTKLESDFLCHMQIREQSCIFVEIGEDGYRLRNCNMLIKYPNSDIDFQGIKNFMLQTRSDASDLILSDMTENYAEQSQKAIRIGLNELERIDVMLTKETIDTDSIMQYGKGWFDTEKYAYRIDDGIDADRFYLQTALFGIFGYHKLKTKEYIQALLYFFTGGFCGIAVLVDLLQMARGHYSYMQYDYELEAEKAVKRNKEKVFLRKIENKRKAVLLALASILLSLCMNFCIYPAVTSTITKSVISNTKEYAEENPQKAQELLEQLNINFE